jgi:hypothetical protein
MAQGDAETDTETGAAPDSETMARLRQSGISIDKEGDFIHQGERVQHEGLRRALFRWLDRLPGPDGRYVLRLDPRRFAYVEVEDTPLVVRAARRDADGFHLALSDGTEEVLAPRTLTVDGLGILRCSVRGGRLEARLSTSAATMLADTLELARPGGDPGRQEVVLHAPDGDFLVPQRARSTG